MSDEEDYLSDKFLAELGSSSNSRNALPKTYSQLRKETQRQAELKSQRNRIKSRREIEQEVKQAREEALKQSLFERTKEDEARGLVGESGNKALGIMMKMGFKPGMALGRDNDSSSSHSAGNVSTTSLDNTGVQTETSERKHKTEPLPLTEWEGRQGIGVGKRPRSPSSIDRLAKMAKLAENAATAAAHNDFRDRVRQEYEEKRAEGRLIPAQRTCATLDEKAGKTFNVLWLNPKDVTTFPPDLLEALSFHSSVDLPTPVEQVDETKGFEVRLRRQMQADALQSLAGNSDGDDDDSDNLLAMKMTKKSDQSSVIVDADVSPDVLEETVQYLRLQAPDRLQLVLSYLREMYLYCFWCGTEYKSREELLNQCPGLHEVDHD